MNELTDEIWKRLWILILLLLDQNYSNKSISFFSQIEEELNSLNEKFLHRLLLFHFETSFIEPSSRIHITHHHLFQPLNWTFSFLYSIHVQEKIFKPSKEIYFVLFPSIINGPEQEPPRFQMECPAIPGPKLRLPNYIVVNLEDTCLFIGLEFYVTNSARGLMNFYVFPHNLPQVWWSGVELRN